MRATAPLSSVRTNVSGANLLPSPARVPSTPAGGGSIDFPTGGFSTGTHRVTESPSRGTRVTGGHEPRSETLLGPLHASLVSAVPLTLACRGFAPVVVGSRSAIVTRMLEVTPAVVYAASVPVNVFFPAIGTLAPDVSRSVSS